MNRSVSSLLLATFIASCIFNVFGQAPDKPRQGFLSVLKKDQQVILKEAAGRYDITLMEGVSVPLTHKVIEVEGDFIMVEDIAEVIQTRIPIYSIKSVASIKTPKN
jgi:hypothetical protein